MWIPRIVESELARDTHTAWGTFWRKGAKVLLMSELKDKIHGDCLVALPNPVPAYLSIVQDSLSTAKSIRENMFGEKSFFPARAERTVFTNIKVKEFDEYFQVATALTIFSFIALEAWCNQIIPEDYIHMRKRPRKCLRFLMRDEKLNKAAIERWMSLDDKLVYLIPAITSKPHFKADALWQRYKRANAARDEFTHLKSPAKVGNDKTNYDSFFQRVLNIDLEDVAALPKDIMTYFIPENLGF